MTQHQLLASAAILAGAGFAHGLFGIGFAMIATPLLALFLDYRPARRLLRNFIVCMVAALGVRALLLLR